MYQYFTELNHSIIKNYINRKHEDMLALFYNLRNQKFVVVPRKIEHLTFVCLIAGVSEEEIIKEKVDVSYFIPVTVVIKENMFFSMIIGTSSFEMGGGVRHKKDDLFKARGATRVLLGRGPLKIKEGFIEFISMDFVI